MVIYLNLFSAMKYIMNIKGKIEKQERQKISRPAMIMMSAKFTITFEFPPTRFVIPYCLHSNLSHSPQYKELNANESLVFSPFYPNFRSPADEDNKRWHTYEMNLLFDSNEKSIPKGRTRLLLDFVLYPSSPGSYNISFQFSRNFLNI